MKARVSALVDGELEPAEMTSAVADVLQGDAEARDAWRMYHFVNDAMHGSHLLSPGFSARVARRLNDEPTVLAPMQSAPAALRPRTRPFAQRYVYPAAASLAAVAFVGWLGLPQQELSQSAPQLAALPLPAKNVESPIIRIPPPRAAQEYLLAHQGFSPRNELQGLAPYVRTVADGSTDQGKR